MEVATWPDEALRRRATSGGSASAPTPIRPVRSDSKPKAVRVASFKLVNTSLGNIRCLVRNEMSDFSVLCSTSLCSKSMEAQHVDRNHSTEV